MKNYLIIDPAVPHRVAQDFNTHFEHWLTSTIFPMLVNRLGEALPTEMSAITFNEDTITLGSCQVRFVLIPGYRRMDFIPLQDKVNTEYLEAIDSACQQITAILGKSRHLPDYPFWESLPDALEQILRDLQGDVCPATVTRIRTEFSHYFSLEQAAHLKQNPGRDLFKSLLSILLILDRIFVLPPSILGNFLPQELVQEEYSTIEIYSDALLTYGADAVDVVRHEFFHFVHYACIKACQGRWLDYSHSFQEDLAVVESLARYFDGTPETLGAFPGNPYFGANYLKLFELLSDDSTPVHYHESNQTPLCFKGELAPREAATINSLYQKYANGLEESAFKQVFALSLRDMGKAYQFMSEIRHLCLTRVEITA